MAGNYIKKPDLNSGSATIEFRFSLFIINERNTINAGFSDIKE